MRKFRVESRLSTNLFLASQPIQASSHDSSHVKTSPLFFFYFFLFGFALLMSFAPFRKLQDWIDSKCNQDKRCCKSDGDAGHISYYVSKIPCILLTRGKHRYVQCEKCGDERKRSENNCDDSEEQDCVSLLCGRVSANSGKAGLGRRHVFLLQIE